MTLNICVELFYRVFFELLKYFIENWLSVLITIVIISWIANMLKEAVLMLALLASFLNISGDIILGSTGGLSTPITVLISLAIGIFWVVMLNTSSVNSLFKVVNIPIVFLAGFTWGMVTIPIPLSLIIGVMLHFRITNYLIGFLPTIGLIFFTWFAGSFICRMLNSVIMLLS
ncbi:MAG: hypothetical protein KKG75_00680 [Nanoarchaeota archaeon]|nr:hypothetical protein [Nanoarchaeota archaeon]